MKELFAHGSNLILAPDISEAPKVKAQIELILIYSEAAYECGLEGLTRTRTVSDMRVLCSHKALRDMAEQLLKLAGEAESLESVMNGAMAAGLLAKGE